MSFSIATWNINSVRLRLPLVEQFLRDSRPDVLCLQETKCPDDLFPHAAFHALGYDHIAVSGQKGYHGVATISRRPLSAIDRVGFCGIGDCRHLSAVVAAGQKRLRIHNFYVPAGGDEPDPAINPKFAHKLGFLEEMKAILADMGDGCSSLLVGDLNIAPLETDVWSHKQLLRVVSHTPVETEGLEVVRQIGGWSDLMRHHIPPEEKIFTWWSYRARDWDVSDRGRRLDHIWGSSDLEGDLSSVTILREARGWERPSDHVPVIAHFNLD
ncbi:exodeoxyribonuclease III [Phyllobacterium phragmitis]|uniref:Exodeoxyribonuclease III n=1 Tax=Phyllobacterium phragmitis TaxID=2670329 RepID=A0A2S9IVA7_9HYPH|nr:exodeoxyribonuclease III [Phyllobacterium phragmitis]PRD44448.1 exodeoxyribonuclease III [Phyllobacterium phragmitis]